MPIFITKFFPSAYLHVSIIADDENKCDLQRFSKYSKTIKTVNTLRSWIKVARLIIKKNQIFIQHTIRF